MARRAVASVNLAAIERNVAALRARLGAARLCAVVKADGYGHGAVACARAAVAGGARGLAVATAGEAVALRGGGVSGPLLVMGALEGDELPEAIVAGAEVVAWSEPFLARVREHAGARPVRVHVKLDTGMGRLGTRARGEALAVAGRVHATPGLELAGAMTHFATADDDLEFVAAQLAAFAPFVAELRRGGAALIAHAANSAATLRVPESHFDLVRCGIAIYGADPMHADGREHGLEAALTLTSYVAAIKAAAPGESAGYGRRFVAREPTAIATIPIGYGDGVRRALTNNCDVLIGGHRYPLVGTVSMDNITAEVGGDPVVRVGDTVTLIGRDGDERQSAEDLARRLDTISYEVLCGLSGRVTRRYHRDGVPCDP